MKRYLQVQKNIECDNSYDGYKYNIYYNYNKHNIKDSFEASL
ncbi:hypothetical protein SH2C18_06290 [Clostridium sediminicola]